MQKMIFSQSPHDLAWHNWKILPGEKMSSVVVRLLTETVTDYHDTSKRNHNRDRADLEEKFVGFCQRRWTEIRPLSRQNTAAFMPRELPPELRSKIREYADHTDTHWIPPESREQVVQYIEETYAFNEI